MGPRPLPLHLMTAMGVLTSSTAALPAMTLESVGYGAGNDRPGATPNVLRAVVGRTPGLASDRIVCLETNLDDLVPEHFDYLMERLLEAGALDVSIQHVQMKKNRPGFLVRVLARPPDRETLAGILFAESTALGVRASEWERRILARESARVDTPYGRIAVSTCRDGDFPAYIQQAGAMGADIMLNPSWFTRRVLRPTTVCELSRTVSPWSARCKTGSPT